MKRIFAAMLLLSLPLTACGQETPVQPSAALEPEATVPVKTEAAHHFDLDSEILAEVYDSRWAKVYRQPESVPLEDAELILRAAGLADSLELEAFSEDGLAERKELTGDGAALSLRLSQDGRTVTYRFDSIGLYMQVDDACYQVLSDADAVESLFYDVWDQIPRIFSFGYTAMNNLSSAYTLSDGLSLHMPYSQVLELLGPPSEITQTVLEDDGQTAVLELAYNGSMILTMYGPGVASGDLTGSMLIRAVAYDPLYETADGAAVGTKLDELLAAYHLQYANEDFSSRTHLPVPSVDAWCQVKQCMAGGDTLPAELLFYIEDDAVSCLVLQDYLLFGDAAELSQDALQSRYRLFGGGAGDSSLTYIVTDTGSLYGRGSNHFMELFWGDDGDYDWMHLMSGVEKVYFGAQNNFALKSNGDLYGWGMRNDYNVFRETKNDMSYRHLIMRDVTDFATDGYECYAVKSDGSLWGWGRDHDAPEQIMDDAASVYFCGFGLFCAIDSKGDAYLWECRQQYDPGEDLRRIPEPVYIASGIQSAAFLDQESRCIQLLGADGSVLLFDVYDQIDEDGNLLDKPLSIIAEDVRMICDGGYIKADDSFWYWASGAAGFEGEHIADNVLLANAAYMDSATVLTKDEELIVFESGIPARLWAMDSFS